MTVAQLLMKLKKTPQNLEIYIIDEEGNCFKPVTVAIDDFESGQDYLVIQS